MCGITAYIGDTNSFNILYNSLKLLQNRGYDSAGIASVCTTTNTIINSKFASSTAASAIEQLECCDDVHKFNTLGIAHTRWATHGEKNRVNAHPHCSTNNTISIVHNGIIENYLHIIKYYNLKNISETDSECICNLIEMFIEKGYNTNEAIENTCDILKGSWAIAIINKNEPNS